MTDRGSLLAGKLMLFGVLLALLVSTGCRCPRGQGPAAAAGRYFCNRALDLSDIVNVGLIAARGARVDFKYGLGVWGAGWGHGVMARIGQRQPLASVAWMEIAPVPFPFSGLLYLPGVVVGADLDYDPEAVLAYSLTEEEEWDLPLGQHVALPPFKQLYSGHPPMAPFGFGRLHPESAEPPYVVSTYSRLFFHVYRSSATPDRTNWGKTFAVGAELTAGVGARFRFYPVEALDFVLGIVGEDILGDDVTAEPTSDEGTVKPAFGRRPVPLELPPFK